MIVKMSAWITSKPFRRLCVLMAALMMFSVTVFAEEAVDPGESPTTQAPETQPPTETQPPETQPPTTQAPATTVEPATTAVPATEEETQSPEDKQKLNDLQKQYDKIEDELKDNEEKLNQVSGEKKQQKQVVSSIYTQIDSTQDQINLLTTRINLLNVDISNTNSQISVINGQINSLNGQIGATETAIDKKEEDLDETYELLKARIRAMYMAGNGSTIEFLLTSQNFATLMTRSEMLMRVAQHDNDLMATIETEISDLETLENTLDTSKKQVEGKKVELSSKVEALNHTKQDVQETTAMLVAKQNQIKSQYVQAQQELNSMNKESAEYVALIRQQENQLDDVSKQMEEYIKKNGSKTTDVKTTRERVTDVNGDEVEDDTPIYVTTGSTKMIFPLKCSGIYISSPYGYRTHPITGQYKLHTGTDFTAGGINQKPIYAVRDGVVIYAQFQKAYGNFIMIDHGDGITTCYAHCDSISVVKGDRVVQGQVIGRVGSTGYSTGPHLHFEVRVNGSTTDPMLYVSIPK